MPCRADLGLRVPGDYRHPGQGTDYALSLGCVSTVDPYAVRQGAVSQVYAVSLHKVSMNARDPRLIPNP